MATTGEEVWGYWCGTSSSTSTTYSSSDYVWNAWTDTSGTICSTDNSTSYSTGDLIYKVWVSDSTDHYSYVVESQEPRVSFNSYHYEPPVSKTFDQWMLEVRQWCQRELNAAWQKHLWELKEKERAEAEETAKELLIELIGEDQREVYERTGRVLVHGKKFDYIVPKTGHVKKIEKNKLRDLCIHIANRYAFPETDNVIALKTMIENDEDAFLKTANDHGVRSGQVPEAACG